MDKVKKVLIENKKEILVYGAVFIITVFLTLMFSPIIFPYGMHMGMDSKRDAFISLKEDIQGNMRGNHQYRCCLETPCTYCIEKSPGHGEGAECDCLSDLVYGVHPCGECIGEIMEGHGNKYLAEYFAKAIAEKVGEEHLPTLKQIMFEKYGVAIEDQA